MIAFITTIRHPDNSSSYARVEDLLRQTLLSVCNQSSSDFVVIVVGNRRPSFPLPDRVKFVEVDFPAPAPPTGPATPRTAFVWDKGTKVGIGLVAARAYNPDHVMIFDADDFVSSRLVDFVRSYARDRAWVVSQGLMYSRARNSWRKISEFNRTCGTCFIIPYATYGVPRSLTLSASQDEIESAFGERLWRIMGAHRDADEWFRQNGIRLDPLPFPAAVYHVDTGENHSGKALSGLALPLTNAVVREFSVPRTLSAPRSVWRSLGPSSVVVSAGRRIRAALARE